MALLCVHVWLFWLDKLQPACRCSAPVPSQIAKSPLLAKRYPRHPHAAQHSGSIARVRGCPESR
eukprot:scaffold500051_cov18-Prasinocladus_malaysianus.AAC.1